MKGYDYTQPGVYFITICTYQRDCLLGDIVEDEMVLNECGKIVHDEWFKTAEIRKNVELHKGEFVVMPNHVHGIIRVIEPDVGVTGPVTPTTQNNRPHGPKPGSIGAIIGHFKTVTTKRTNQFFDSRGAPVWQRNYYEHIIHNKRELRAIQQYIHANPVNWQLDQDNLANFMGDTQL